MDLVLGHTKELFVLLGVTLALWLCKTLSIIITHTEICWDKMTRGLGFASNYLDNSKTKQNEGREALANYVF